MSIEKEDLSNIFDIAVNNQSDIEDTIFILILEKVNELDNVVDYFSQCFERAKSLSQEANMLKYFINYIMIDMEGNTVQSIVEHINNYNLNFIEYFFKNSSSNTNLTNIFKRAYLDIPYDTLRLEKLYILFQSKFIRENIFQEILQDGASNEYEGYFALFTDSLSKNWNIDIGPVKPLLDLFINDDESCSRLIKLIRQHLILNISYTYTQQKFININRCSSVKYICFLFKIMLYIFNIRYSKSKNLLDLPRNDYELLDGDDLITQTFITTLFAFKISYIPLARIYYTIDKEYKIFIERMNSNLIFVDNFPKKKEEYKLQLDRISAIFKDMNFHSDVFKFVETVVKHDLFISDDVVHNINDFIIGCIIDYNMKSFPIEFINYILKVIGGGYKASVHERFAVGTTLKLICDEFGYKFFTSFNENNNNITTKLFFTVMKLIINVNHFEWTTLKFSHKFYRDMLGILSFCSDKLDSVDDMENDASQLFHKITSRMNSSISDMEELCKRIVEKMKSYPGMDINLMRNECKHLINEFVNTLMVSIKTLQTLINNNIFVIKDLPMELILPLCAFSVALLTLLSDGKNPIYSVFQLNMETLALMQELFKLINMGCINNNFTESIKDNLTIIKEMVNRVNLDRDLKNSLVNYLGNLDNDLLNCGGAIDLPDEFMDPFLVTEIKNPVMIPKIDQIFDKSSILLQLNYEEINPYTRETLTKKEFEEYNKRDDVKNKISKFIEKLTDYKKNLQN